MTLAYYYNSNAVPPESQVVDKNWVAYYGGIDPSTSTPEQLAAAGFYLYTQTAAPTVNPQIYTVESSFVTEGTNATSVYTVVPLPLSESKGTYTSETKAKAYTILQPTDWLVVRQVENGSSIPTDWNDWRESIRLESQGKVAAIDACETADALETYVSSEAYSYWPPEPTTPKLA
jgi:hypothetical protein